MFTSGEKPANYFDLNLDGVFDLRHRDGKNLIWLQETWKEFEQSGSSFSYAVPKVVLIDTGEEFTFATGRWIPSSEL